MAPPIVRGCGDYHQPHCPVQPAHKMINGAFPAEPLWNRAEVIEELKKAYTKGWADAEEQTN